MATQTSSNNTLAFRKPRRGSLIEWDDPSRQAHILDWRHRAHDFGLPVDEREDVAAGQPYHVDPEQLLEEEEPEAFAEQPIPRSDQIEGDEDSEEAPVGREDVDLVRMYLKHIGKRRLLKAAEEVALG